MKIKFLGAAGEVTGSSYILTSDSDTSILIDLGMFQGTPEVDKLNYIPFDCDCAALSGVVLTHAHLDHCGRLPILLKKGYRGDIWMTPATRDLTEISLLDSAKIAREDGKGLYDTNLAEETIQKFKTVDYRKPFSVGDFTVTFRDAGHILGAASLEIIDNKSKSEFKKMVFSGDLGKPPEDLLQNTEVLDSADVIVIESTYGDKLHPKSSAIDALQSEINTIENSGGVLLIPAFSLDRTQELLHMIMHLKKDGKVQEKTEVDMDGPLAQKATAIYLDHSDLFNDHVKEDLKLGNPFEFPGLNVIHDGKQSAALHETLGPKVIIAGSGMMVGGRIIGHAAYYLPIASTRLFIVGYMGEGTLGRAILEGDKEVNIDGVNTKVNATVNSTASMSSHADQLQLIDWLSHISGVKKVFITHGDDIPRAALSKKISDKFGITDITLPTIDQEVNI